MLIDKIRSSVIGAHRRRHTVRHPQSRLRLHGVGAFALIHRGLHQEVLPMYANTHTEPRERVCRPPFREEACHDPSSGGAEHATIFAGSGSTGAIGRPIGIMVCGFPAVGRSSGSPNASPQTNGR